jgi:choline kinase/thiamine kinase-like enzyme
MKAIVLANLGEAHFSNNEMVPSCFMPLYNDMTVIERQISLLNVNGFSNDDICVLFGSLGLWNIPSVRERIDRINTKKLFAKRTNVLCEDLFNSLFIGDEDVLIIEGNIVFDLGILSRLKRYRQKNVMVVCDLLNPDKADEVVKTDGHRVISIGNSELMTFPWVEFAGIVRLSADLVNSLKNAHISQMSLLDGINEILGKHEITSINYEDLQKGKINGGHSDELVGGSYSKVNYRLVVKKEDGGAGRKKLINEINWLLTLPSELKSYFSQVLEYNIESDKVYYNVPYYGSRNLREHIFDGHFDSDAAIYFLETLLDWMFKNVYSRKIGDAPGNWIIEKHISRVLDRLVECSEKSETLAKLISSDKIIINGVLYKNIKELYTEISDRADILDILKPHDLVMIHGDLHFQNILLYNETDTGFVLVDPRGELLGSDIYYDIGKLLHSFHGKYDFMHTDQFRLDLSWGWGGLPNAEIDITNTLIEKVYDEIYEKFLRLIKKYDIIRSDPYWEMKALFSEASHFSSVTTFHIGKTTTTERAIVLYLTGVKLINEFCQKFLDENAVEVQM